MVFIALVIDILKIDLFFSHYNSFESSAYVPKKFL